MATIYRFLVEERTRSGGRSSRSSGDSSSPSRKTTGKGKWVSLFSGPHGGVEHNRKLRAINPLLNKATGGYWEKGMRLGRAGMGLVKRNTETGKIGISLPAIAIIIALIIQTIFKIQNKQRDIANKQNTQNYKAMENGFSAIHGEYRVSRDFWSGRTTFNENK